MASRPLDEQGVLEGVRVTTDEKVKITSNDSIQVACLRRTSSPVQQPQTVDIAVHADFAGHVELVALAGIAE